ncbi:murein biosynthesis integral membrane protein MurJ [Planctomycetota bacterium]
MQQQNLQQSSLNEYHGSINKIRLGRIVISLSAIMIVTKIFGFIEKVVIANFFGTGDMADVYFVSMGIVLSIVFLVKELVYPSLLPVFMETLSKGPYVSASLFRKVFLSSASLLAVVAIVFIVFPGLITHLIAPGFSDSKQQITCTLIKMLAPTVFFLSLAMVTYTTLNSRRRFLTAALPEAGFKLFIVVMLISLVPLQGIHAVAIAMGLGAFGYLIVQLYFIPDSRFLFINKDSTENKDYFKKVLLLMSPLVLGVVFSHISGLVDNILASTLPTGHLSYLGYSKKFIDAVLLAGPVTLVVVFFSHASHMASIDDLATLARMIKKIIKLLIYTSVPATCLLISLRQPIIRVFFQRGYFTSESTFGTSQALLIYSLGLTTFSLETLLVHGFFALSDTKTPVKFGIICVCLDICLAILFIKPLGYLGIAIAFVISKTIKTIILAVKLEKKLTGLFDSGLLILAVKLILSTTIMWVTVLFLLKIDNADTLLYAAALDLVLPGIGGVLVFIACSWLLKIDELQQVISILKKRQAVVNSITGKDKLPKALK